MRIRGKLFLEFDEGLLFGHIEQRRDGSIGPKLPLDIGNTLSREIVLQVDNHLDFPFQRIGHGSQIDVEQKKDSDARERECRRRDRHHRRGSIRKDIRHRFAQQIGQAPHTAICGCV